MLSRKRFGTLILGGLAAGLLLAAAPFLPGFLRFIAYLLVTPLAFVAVPVLSVVACVFVSLLLRLCGWSARRAWSGAIVVVGALTAFLVVDARQAPANVWGPNPEAHPTKGIVAPALHWILENSPEQRNSPWAPSDVQKSYGTQVAVTATVVEPGPRRCLIKGTIANRGRAVVRNVVVQIEVSDAQNRKVGMWRDDVVAFDPERLEGDAVPLRPGESRGFVGEIPVPPVLWARGPATPLHLAVKATDLRVEKIPAAR